MPDYLCRISGIYQRSVDLHCNFYVLQFDYVCDLGAPTVAGFGYYGGGSGSRGYQYFILCNAEKNPRYPKGGRP